MGFKLALSLISDETLPVFLSTFWKAVPDIAIGLSSWRPEIVSARRVHPPTGWGVNPSTGQVIVLSVLRHHSRTYHFGI